MRTLLHGLLLFLVVACRPADSRRAAEPDALGEPSISKKGDTVTVPGMETMVAEINCQYDNASSSLGIGLMLAPEAFTIYNDASLQDVFATVDLYADDEGHQGICPRFYGPEYAIMHFVCVDSTGDAYKVLTDYALVKYLSKTSGAEFKTWTEYIMDSFGIRRTRQEGGAADVRPPIKREPSETSAALEIPEGHEMFCPMEVRGEWVKVKYDCFYNQSENPHEGEPCHHFIGECEAPLTGWLRWHKENTLLIDIFLMP